MVNETVLDSPIAARSGMIVECSRKELLEALSLAGAAASTRTALPILTTLQITARESSLTLLGCDSEMWAQRTILANVSAPGATCVSARLLTDIVALLPEGQLTLELENSTLFLRQGASEWRLPALPADQFPEIPGLEKTSSLRLPMSEFRAAVDRVAYAVADDSSRPVLTGVLFAYDGSKLIMVATDTHRLAVTTLTKEGIGSEINAIVPEKALKAIKSLPLDDGEELSIDFDGVRMSVDSGNCKIVAQLLADRFPNWERVVPQEHTRVWSVDRGELGDNVKRAMILARDNANRVRFSGQDDRILISARSEEKGEAKEFVPIVATNGDVEIAFNGRYILEALASFKSDGVRIEMTEPSRPAVFKGSEDDDGQFCVIMPMALG